MTRDATQKRLLRELWDRDHRYYELAREHVREAASAPKEYGFLRRHLPAEGTFLEVGCGEGSNMETLELKRALEDMTRRMDELRRFL